MKREYYRSLLLATLILALSFVATPSMVSGALPSEIKICVVGPMAFIQGIGANEGATLAVEQINAAGGIGGKNVVLFAEDTNEILNPAESAVAIERCVDLNGAHAIIGGFRTEGVIPMQEAAMDRHAIFLGIGASTDLFTQNVLNNYARYKYFFRVNPVNSTTLFQTILANLMYTATVIKTATGVDKVKVAILAEQATWNEAMVQGFQYYITQAPFNTVMEFVPEPVYRPSPLATDVSGELESIRSKGTQLIIDILSGSVGLPFVQQWANLEVPALPFGINVVSQSDEFYAQTGGASLYEMYLSTPPRVPDGHAMASTVNPFYDAYYAKFTHGPIYTAFGAYDAIRILKAAIERAGSVESDALVTALEQTDYYGLQGRLVFTNSHDVFSATGYVRAMFLQWQLKDGAGSREIIFPADLATSSIQLPPRLLPTTTTTTLATTTTTLATTTTTLATTTTTIPVPIFIGLVPVLSGAATVLMARRLRKRKVA